MSESKSVDSLAKEVTAVKNSLTELETTLTNNLKHDLNDLRGDIKKLMETEIKRIHQRFDQADASMKVASEIDLGKEFEPRLHSIAEQIDQLSKGMHHDAPVRKWYQAKRQTRSCPTCAAWPAP